MNLRVILLFVAGSIFFAIQVSPTPYWDERDFETFQTQRFFPHGVGEMPERPFLDYSYPYQLSEIARFLSVWQVSDSASPDYGGMREGEHPEVQNIIETDNTQESVWIWCRYGQLTGDTATFRPNIDAAWTYVSNYPAYDEEGTQSPYYRIHNCGWALVACQIFEEVYGDGSKEIYADSCADYIVTRKDSLPFDDFNFYGRLHPFVAGWGAGALYKYGLYRGTQDYVDTALVIGARVADWVDSNSARRLSDEVWAMSSGTAMWGVVNSVVADDPSGWFAWLTDFAESLQVYQEASSWGDWNNSWNIWYASAFNSIARALADSKYADYHRMLTDTLLIQDTDEDGGIPANSMHTDTMDQSWVSCYLGMMGIEGLIDSLPAHDVGPLAFLSPHEEVLIPVGDSVSVAVTAVNYGLSSESGVPIEVIGGFSAATTVDLPVASSDTAFFPGFWVPLVDSIYELAVYTSLPLDEDLSNDTVRVSITVLPVVTVSGSVKDSLGGDGIDAWLYFRRMGPPADTLWDSTSTDISGDFSVSLVTGSYDIQISPSIPYPETTVVGVEVVKDSTVRVDVRLTPARLLIMDDDEGKNYESYYTSSLDSIGVSYILWDVSSQGTFPISIMSLFGSPIIIWFTGDALTNTLTLEDQDSLSSFLDSGGNLFLTGQNIGQDIGDSLFYSDYLHSVFNLPTTNDHTIDGLPGDEIGDDLSILTAGSPGAGNQISQDIISPDSVADTVLMYSPLDCAAIKYDSGTYKVVYFGFGFEGIASRPAQGYDFNWFVLKRVLHWFDESIVVVDEDNSYLRQEGKSRFLLSVSPNPFRREAVVTFEIPALAEQEVSLRVYDVSGRQVSSVWAQARGERKSGVNRIIWNGSDVMGEKLKSGVYFLKLGTNNKSVVSKVVILR